MTESNIDSTTDSDCTGFDRRDTGCGRQCACQTRSAGAVQWNRDYGQRSKPCAGQSVLQSTTVVLTASSAGQNPPSQTVTVPDLIGETRAAADSALARLGLQAQFSGTGTTVNDQSPPPEEQVLQGSTVILTVGTDQAPPTLPPPPPRMVTVPDVIGLTQAAATNVLGRLGLDVRFSGTGSTVSHQSPAPGQQVQQGSTVVLTMSGNSIPK
jgi:beta-lactam-binding protein with PASTA domain